MPPITLPKITTSPFWGVVATVREPTSLILAFAAHHLCLGAAEVWLFFDDPDDPTIDVVRDLPRVHAVVCDAAYWAMRRRDRPALQNQRQLANATWAYNHSTVDWLLHIDADEFLWLTAPLSSDIARLGPEHGWLKLRNFERVWLPATPNETIFNGAFRKPSQPDQIDLNAVYGSATQYLRQGLAGYPIGKALSATGRGFRLNVHSPRGGDAPKHGLPPFRVAHYAFVLHFDGLTPLHWVRKSLRYAQQANRLDDLVHIERRRQIERLHGASIDEALAFHGALFRLDRAQTRALKRAGRLFWPKGFDPVRSVANVAQMPLPDYAPAAWDAGL